MQFILKRFKKIIGSTPAFYVDTILHSVIQKQTKQSGKGPKAIFTDIDDTLYRTGHEDEMKEFLKLIKASSIPLIAVTGNDYKGVMRRIREGQLPYFEVIAGSVGTEIWFLHKGSDGKLKYKEDIFYKKHLEAINFSRPKLVVRSHEMIEFFSRNYPELHLNFQIPEKEMELISNPDPIYQPFKISFYFFSSLEDISVVRKNVKDRFGEYPIVICEEINHNSTLPASAKIKKYCLDIVPATKRNAVEYICSKNKIVQGLVAGDSGNDTEMLVETGKLNAILVGGHTQDARIDIDFASGENKNSFRQIYTKKGKKRKILFVEQNPNRIAAGSLLFAFKAFERAEFLKDLRKIASLSVFKLALGYVKNLGFHKNS